ncbi:MAG: hypothetical protein ABI056_05585 [Caulobacteraceae bacterium]
MARCFGGAQNRVTSLPSPGRAADRLLVVVGLRREAAIAAGRGNRVLTGTDGLGEALASAGAVISFGLCGALASELRVGDLVIGAGGTCDGAWSEGLAARLPGARRGRIAGVDRPSATVAEKARLRAASGAIAVDMESHRVAAAARAVGLPYAILRAVSDGADRELPRAATAGFAKNGRPNLRAVLLALARRPWELPALIGTARDAGIAFAALRDARDLLGPGLGCPYLVQHSIDVV